MIKTEAPVVTVNTDGTYTLNLSSQPVGWMQRTKRGWRGVTMRGNIVRASTLPDCRQLLMEAVQ